MKGGIVFMAKMTVARAMVEVLKSEGVEIIFGIPGAAIYPFYDALYSSDIKHVLVRTEQAAVHEASGYARTTGKVGVCVATSGPGATNLITGIATAYMDSVPIVGYHRSGKFKFNWERCVSRSGYNRGNSSVYQA